MQESRRRGQPNAGRGQRTTVEAGGGNVFSWLQANVGKSIIVAAFVAAMTGWLSGFFESVLRETVPSGADAFCAVREAVEYYWPFAVPPTTSDRFTILIATIDRDDADRTYTRAIARAFFHKDGIE